MSIKLFDELNLSNHVFGATQDPDDVIDPKSSYYDAGGISTMDVIKAKLTPEQFKGYLLGNQIKYSLRLNHKGDPERDAEKAANYSRLLVEQR